MLPYVNEIPNTTYFIQLVVNLRNYQQGVWASQCHWAVHLCNQSWEKNCKLARAKIWKKKYKIKFDTTPVTGWTEDPRRTLITSGMICIGRKSCMDVLVLKAKRSCAKYMVSCIYVHRAACRLIAELGEHSYAQCLILTHM